ncbi:hypothetical protein IFM89_028420 [Coptis chinensis]|uniref:Myb/SANT-like domain-containing protein n=1 Tax=Coptis chinensis TaxID=261450 RepID=A0A835M9X3_9MAGN|nr:hypothetical protein IFM89_028420 [Coptis chinensis]
MEEKFKAKFGPSFTTKLLKNHYRALKKNYNCIKTILSESGFGWDNEREMVYDDHDHVWDNYIKAHPEFNMWRTKFMSGYEDLCIVFGDGGTTGKYSRALEEKDVTNEKSSATNAENLNGEGSQSPILAGGGLGQQSTKLPNPDLSPPPPSLPTAISNVESPKTCFSGNDISHINISVTNSSRNALGHNHPLASLSASSHSLLSSSKPSAWQEDSAAENSYTVALQIDPSIRRSKSFKVDAVDPKSRHKGKLETENLLQSRDVNWTSIRSVYIYGPLNYNPVEEWFFHRFKAGCPIPVPNSGVQITQLGHVKDLATALIQVLDISRQPYISGNLTTFNFTKDEAANSKQSYKWQRVLLKVIREALAGDQAQNIDPKVVMGGCKSFHVKVEKFMSYSVVQLVF